MMDSPSAYSFDDSQSAVSRTETFRTENETVGLLQETQAADFDNNEVRVEHDTSTSGLAKGQGNVLKGSDHGNRQLSDSRPRFLRLICATLHIALMFLHFGIIVLSLTHVEKHQMFQLGEESIVWSTRLYVILHLSILIYTSLMLFLTQRLSTHRDLITPQLLTTIHDKSIAWNGLGASLHTLIRQFSAPSSAWDVSAIVLYLTGLSVLQISTPTILRLENVNNMVRADVNSTAVLPNFPDTITNSTYDAFVRATSVLPLVGQSRQLSAIGLHGDTVYDVLDKNPGFGLVDINTTTFDVFCSPLGNPRVSNGSSTWNISADRVVDNKQNWVSSEFQVSVIAPNVVRMALLGHDGQQLDMNSGNRVLLYSSINFTDSEGDNGSRITLNPLMMPNISVEIPARNASEVYSLQVMACRFSSRNEPRQVDAQTRLLASPPSLKTSSTWSMDSGPASQKSGNKELTTILDWNNILSMASKMRSNVDAAKCDGKCDSLTLLDQFLLENLDIQPDLDPVINPQRPPQLQLYQLENALAHLTAALHWSTTQLPFVSSEPDKQNMPAVRKTSALQPQSAARLRFNIPSIAIGQVISVVLFIISMSLIGKNGQKAASVDGSGILQVVWLLYNHPDLRDHITHATPPSVINLRQAGMVSVQLAEETAVATRRPYVDMEKEGQEHVEVNANR